jgi:microcystin-dependent protein
VGHVSSADVGRFQAGICGTGRYVLKTGDRFAATIESANTVSIASGDAVDQGRHIVIPTNSTEVVGIQSCAAGKVRKDLIALQYTKNTASPDGIESAEVVVLRGTEVAEDSTPTAPAPTTGDIIGGDALDQMALYEVLVTSQGATEVTAVFTLVEPLSGIINAAKSAILNAAYPVGSIYISAAATNPRTLFGGTWTRIQGKFLLGASSSHAAGSTGGAETVTLTAAQIPGHTHSIPGHTHSVPNHTHTVPAHSHTASCATAGEHAHRQTRALVAAAGTARYAVQGTDSAVHGQTQEGGAHSHDITVNSKAAFSTTSSGSCTTGSTSGTTGSTGSGSAHSNMPPFLSVYIWQRTA